MTDLQKKLQSKQQPKPEIIAAIAAYLENADWTWRLPYNYTKETIATEIAAAIAPLVDEKDLPLSKLFMHMSEQHDLTLTDTELADIIHVSRCK